jgi:hypothetical protein
MKIAIVFFIILSSTTSFAQPTIQWSKSIGGSSGDIPYSIHATNDGGYIIAGSSSSNNGDIIGNHGASDAVVIKINNSGQIQWQKSLGGSGNDFASAIQQTSDGGFFLMGNTQSTDGDVTSNHGGNDYWAVKLSSLGIIEWQKTYGGTNYDFASSFDQTNDGGYLLFGSTGSIDGDVTGYHGGLDYWIVKINSTGTIVWQKSLGGTSQEDSYSIEKTTDGGCILSGRTQSNNGDVTGYHGGLDYWIVKLSEQGILEWQKCLGGSNDDYGCAVAQTVDGGYITTGYSSSIDGNITDGQIEGGAWIVKMSVDGDIEWDETYGGNGTDFLYSIKQTSEGGYIVVGDTTSQDIPEYNDSYDYWIVKISNIGVLEWQKALGGSNEDTAKDILQTSDQDYIISGLSSSIDGNITDNHGGFDFWIVKLNNDLSIDDPFHSDLTVYPNPASSSLFVAYEDSSASLNYKIYDALGREILNGFVNGEINIDSLNTGTYLLKIVIDKKLYTNVIIKH